MRRVNPDWFLSGLFLVAGTFIFAWLVSSVVLALLMLRLGWYHLGIVVPGFVAANPAIRRNMLEDAIILGGGFVLAFAITRNMVRRILYGPGGSSRVGR